MRKMVPKKVYFTMREVARLLDPTGKMSTETAREWCQRERAARKMGSRWYATRSKLLAAFPELYSALMA